jgi:acyl carrier protein
MKENDIETKVLNILQTISKRTVPIQMETNLREEMDFDSLITLMVMNELDDAFGIEIDEEEFKNVEVAADVVQLLRENYLETGLKTKSAEETGVSAWEKDEVGR